MQTLYIYLGTAGLIGCLTGAILFIIFKVLASTLNIDPTGAPKAREKGRTTAEYRAARRVKKEDLSPHSPIATPIVFKKANASQRRGLLSQAIMEEEDSDY